MSATRTGFPPRIILIGYRGTGKSTVGQQLAAQLSWTFVDADIELENVAGTTIASIFASEGEPGFRICESAILNDVCRRDQVVIATGGGVILLSSNRDRLRASGFVVWLRAEPAVCWERMQRDPTTGQRRPNLTASGGLDEVRMLLQVREPLYQATAHLIVDADVDSPETIAAAILAEWAARTAG